MSTLQLLIVCATTLLLALVAAAIILAKGESPTASVLAGLELGQRVAAHLGDGQSTEGVIVACEPGWVILDSAVLRSGRSETPMAGRVRVPERSVSVVQELASQPTPIESRRTA